MNPADTENIMEKLSKEISHNILRAHQSGLRQVAKLIADKSEEVLMSTDTSVAVHSASDFASSGKVRWEKKEADAISTVLVQLNESVMANIKAIDLIIEKEGA